MAESIGEPERGEPSAAPRDENERSRLRRLRASQSYGLVVALIIATFVFAAVAPDSSWATSVLVLLQSATLVCALWTSGVTPIRSRLTGGLLVLAVGAAVTNLVADGNITTGAVTILTGVLTLAVAVVIARGVVDQREVNKDSVRGAIGIYLLLGLVFAFVYGTAAALGSSPFFVQGTDGTRATRVYFSYITLTTVGYGDYTAAGTFGHTIAIVEALVGQLYLVTVVALLVARIGTRRLK
jgi:hypothetical protein